MAKNKVLSLTERYTQIHQVSQNCRLRQLLRKSKPKHLNNRGQKSKHLQLGTGSSGKAFLQTDFLHYNQFCVKSHIYKQRERLFLPQKPSPPQGHLYRHPGSPPAELPSPSPASQTHSTTSPQLSLVLSPYFPSLMISTHPSPAHPAPSPVGQPKEAARAAPGPTALSEHDGNWEEGWVFLLSSA